MHACMQDGVAAYKDEQLSLHFPPAAFSSKVDPLTLQLCLPVPPCHPAAAAAPPQSPHSSLLLALKRRPVPAEVCMLTTKPAEYNEQLKTHTLVFAGQRVKVSAI